MLEYLSLCARFAVDNFCLLLLSVPLVLFYAGAGAGGLYLFAGILGLLRK